MLPLIGVAWSLNDLIRWWNTPYGAIQNYSGNGWTRCANPTTFCEATTGAPTHQWVFAGSGSCVGLGGCPTGQVYPATSLPAGSPVTAGTGRLIFMKQTGVSGSNLVGTAVSHWFRTVPGTLLGPMTLSPTVPLPEWVLPPAPWLPAIDPMTIPLNRPMPVPAPVPYPMIPHWRPRPGPDGEPRPTPQPGPGVYPRPAPRPEEDPWTNPDIMPRPSPAVRPRPARSPSQQPAIDVGVRIAPRGRPQPFLRPGYHHWRKPPPGVKEKKRGMRARGLGGLLGALNAVTEGLDFLDAFWDALPDWAKTPFATPQEKMGDLWEHWDALNPADVLENLLKEAAEDRFYGSRSAAQAKRNAEQRPHGDLPFGWETGPAL